MKKHFFKVACLLLVLFSCNSDSAFESEFEKSLDAWNVQKKKEGNSYRYTARVTSVFGFGSSTIITVQDGEVFSRAYEAFQYNPQTQEEVITSSWIENKSELSTHEEGAEPLTLDEIYASCRREILSVNKDDNFINFAAENNGILSVCTYFPKNCADDCSVGFYIVNFEWLN